jgi:hypothetical protein
VPDGIEQSETAPLGLLALGPFASRQPLLGERGGGTEPSRTASLEPNASVKTRRKRAGWDPAYLLKVLQLA